MLNLRRHDTKKSKPVNLLGNPSWLSKEMIEELELLVPLKLSKLHQKYDLGWDGIETRVQFIELMRNGIISDKIAQMEIRRRKKMNV